MVMKTATSTRIVLLAALGAAAVLVAVGPLKGQDTVMAKWSVPGTNVQRPVRQPQQALAILTLSDGFLNHFSRHDASRYSLTYWPFQSADGVLQMGLDKCRTNYTGLLPGLGDWVILQDLGPDGPALAETEDALVSQDITPWLLRNVHRVGDGRRMTQAVAVPGMHGVVFRIDSPGPG